MSEPERTTDTRYPAPEWQVRVELAACYRLADLFGWSDIVWNHITARVPGTEHFLINRFGLRFDEVTASNLVTVDLDGNVIDPGVTDPGNGVSEETVNSTGFMIHSAIHAARPDIRCVLHSHTTAGMAVSVLKEGLATLIQDAIPFHGRVSYHDYEGVSVEPDERERLAASLGDNLVMILRHHGLLTCGRSIGEAFMNMYYLDRACRVQLAVQASGQPWAPLPEDLCRTAAAQYEQFAYGKYEWPALLRLADERSPGFRE